MLSKPGEARARSTPSQRRSKKVVEENLDDVVRRLQRLPPNKACADCSSKLTQCVNLTHGTFVCMACSGVHREFNHKIKGIGHSSFTADEVTKLRNIGNEAVNIHYLAKYTPSDRMKPPMNNNDMQHLRSWIQKKYIDKYWCDGKGRERERGGGGMSGGSRGEASGSGSSSGRSSKSKSSKGEGSRRKIMPSQKQQQQQPPTPAPAPVPDPFGFDSIAPMPVASTNNDWDAFGGSSQNQASGGGDVGGGFQADFGNMNSTAQAHAPVAAPPAAAPANNVGNFGQQQPTMVSMAPPAVQQQQQQQQQQPAFQANFGQPQPNQMQQQSNQQMMQQHPNQMQGGFTNFGSMPQQQPQTQQQPPQQQQGFANFGSMPQQQQMQQPQQQMMGQPQNNMQAHMMQGQGVVSQQQGGGGMGNSTMGGQQPQMQMQGQGMVNHQQNMMGGQQPHQQHQQPTNMQGQMMQGGGATMNQQGGMMNLGQVPNQQQQSMQQPQMQHQSSSLSSNDQSAGFANFSSGRQQQNVQTQGGAANGQNMDQMGGMNNMGQPPPQQQPNNVAPSNISAPEQSNEAVSEPKPSMGAPSEQAPPAPEPRQKDEAETSGGSAAMNPNAFSMDSGKKDAFGAFDGLSLEPTPAGSATNETDSAPAPTNTSAPPAYQYKQGQKVVYTNGQGACLADVTKVHLDDELQPYYTINLDGREKQTDNAHLSLPGESTNEGSSTASDSNAVNTPSMMLQETSSMLQKLNTQQLMQVKQFIATMMMSGKDQNGLGATNPHMNAANQQQSFGSVDSGSSAGNNLPSASMGGGAAQQAQLSMQQQPNQGMHTKTMGMGMMNGTMAAPSPAMPPTQPPQMPAPAVSMQQHPNNGQMMGMGMNGHIMPTPAPTVSMQQEPNQQMMHSQSMGMMNGHNTAPPAPPSGMPPPPPAPAQFSMQQQTNGNGVPQQAMGMGAMPLPSPAMPPPPAPPAAVPSPAAPPALPPVEKEGNPFDFY